jgi:hypothetical protein
MRLLRPAVAAAVAAAVALVPLLLLDGPHRTNGFRLYALALGFLAVRAILSFNEASAAPPATSPFHRRRRLPSRPPWTGRRNARAHQRTEYEAMLAAGEDRAGQFHQRLRPVLQRIADERLQARHGMTLGGVEPGDLEPILGPTAYDLLRPDRPRPDDRRAPGPSAADLAATLDAVEAL